MEQLQKEGYSTFLNQYFKNNSELFSNLSKQQKPHTMMITCSDSRINPALLLNAKPGELFIARNIGNVVPAYQPTKGSTQAAIEYSVNVLNIPKIVILGHSNCGACAHMYNEPKEGDIPLPHVEKWLENIIPAKSAAMLEVHANHNKNIFELTEKHNVVVSLQRLMEYPYIQNRLLQHKISLEGWWYDIGTGKVEIYNFNTRQFEEAVVDEAVC
jgi:carbonic anhydrase